MVACLLLTACAGGGVRDEGVVGDRMETGRNHPGNLYVWLAVEYLRQGQMETALHKANHALV